MDAKGAARRAAVSKESKERKAEEAAQLAEENSQLFAMIRSTGAATDNDVSDDAIGDARRKAAKEYGDTAPLLPGNTGKNPCGCTTRNSIRRSAISLVQWWGFDAFILIIIGCNTVMMMTDSPLDTDETSDKAMIIAKMELIFNCIFTIEMSIKITALGCSEYIKDPWNLLDATVVTSAWAPYFLPTSGNYSWLRAVRVLRALRTVNRLPSLKALVNTLLSFETLQGVSAACKRLAACLQLARAGSPR